MADRPAAIAGRSGSTGAGGRRVRPLGPVAPEKLDALLM